MHFWVEEVDEKAKVVVAVEFPEKLQRRMSELKVAELVDRILQLKKLRFHPMLPPCYLPLRLDSGSSSSVLHEEGFLE